MPAAPADRYSREHKLEHNQIARTLVQQFPRREMAEASATLSVSNLNSRGGISDDLSIKMVKAFETELALLQALKRFVLEDAPHADVKAAARHAESCGLKTEQLKREFEARRTRKNPQAFENTHFTALIDGVPFYFEIDFEYNREANRLEITNMDTLERRGNSAPHTLSWVHLAQWVERMTESDDARLQDADPDELIWFDNEGYLRPRAYIQQQYPHIFRALEIIRRGLLLEQPERQRYWWLDAAAT